MSEKKPKPKLFHKDFQKEWSDTHKYKHIHTGEYCTFEAYVAEYLILRKADAFKEPKPAYKFWTKGDKLYPAFVRQLKAAIKLRKKYSEETILNAIKSKHFKSVFYLGLYAKNYVGWQMNPLALEAIECYHKEEQELAKRQEQIKLANENIPQATQEPQQNRRKANLPQKSIINKLRNL